MCVRAYHDIDNPEEIYFYKCDVDGVGYNIQSTSFSTLAEAMEMYLFYKNN